MSLHPPAATSSKPSEERMAEVYALIERRIEDRWSIPVVITDVPEPFTGDLDGTTIQVDYENDIENALFIVIHLFGHTVQWNSSERARTVGLSTQTTWTEDEITEVVDYEQQACAYSLQLLHDCGVHDLDQWLSDFAACDGAYLVHLYRTGEKLPFRSFWKDHQPLVSAAALPEFTPKAWRSRWSGVVV